MNVALLHPLIKSASYAFHARESATGIISQLLWGGWRHQNCKQLLGAFSFHDWHLVVFRSLRKHFRIRRGKITNKKSKRDRHMGITLKWQEICVPWICYHLPTNAIYTCNLYYQKRLLGHLKAGSRNMAIIFIFCFLIRAPPKTNHIAFSTFVGKWHIILCLCYDIVVHVSHVAMISHSLTRKLSSTCIVCHLNMNAWGLDYI